MDAYEGWAEIYDVWVAAEDDVGFYVDEALKDGGPVIELGVGTGRVAVPIAQAGVEVIGIDSSPSMLEIARKRASDAGVTHLISWRDADMRTFRLEKEVGLVLIPARGFLHLENINDQLAGLESSALALRSGGRLIVDLFLPRPELMASLDGVRTHKGSWTGSGGVHYELDEVLTYDPSRQTVGIVGVVETFEGERHMGTRELFTTLRWVGRYEMEHLLARAGLEVEHVYGWFDRRPLDDSSTEMIWIARKP